MSDNAPTGPLISPDTAQHIRQLAADLAQSHPEHSANLLRGLEAYQVPAPPADTRTPAQVLHDRHMGVELRQPGDYTGIDPYAIAVPEGQDASAMVAGARAWCASLALDPVLGAAIANDILTTRDKPTPEQVAAALPPDLEYTEAIKSVDALLARAPMGGAFQPKAADLPPYSLAQLAVWARWMQRHAATRPK
jgi:hypothetical protein